jgi:hypothetical protein
LARYQEREHVAAAQEFVEFVAAHPFAIAIAP